jgi:hypothetical protein
LPLLRFGIHEDIKKSLIKRSRPVKFDQRALHAEVQRICTCILTIHRIDHRDLVNIFRQWPDMANENATILEQGLLVMGSIHCQHCPKPFLILGDDEFVAALRIT